MVVFGKKSQCSTTPSMILNMKNITRCDKFIPKLVTGPAIFASLSILRMSLTDVMPFGSLMKCI